MSQPAAMLLTLVVEVPLYVAALVSLGLLPFWRSLFAAVAVNLLTHPLLWLTLGANPAFSAVALAELAVWVAESMLVWLAVRREFQRTARPGAASPALVGLIAFTANAGSILAGTVIAGAA